MTAYPVRVAVVALWIGMLYACSNSPMVQFYTLSAEAQSGAEHASTDRPLRIAIGPVTLPDVVDRPQVVVRSGANQVSLTEEHRWAESLKTSTPRVIGENLGRLLATGEVWSYPQAPPGPVDYRVQVGIQKFESTPGQSAAIDALWTVRRVSGEQTDVRTGRSSVQQPVTGQDYQAIAAAHSRALATISGEIAEAIRAFPPATP